MSEHKAPRGPHLNHTGHFLKRGGPVIDAIMNRRSVRHYMDVPVDWDKIINCVEAGMMAPSAGNLQIWRFSVVRTAAKRSAIADACLQQHWMEQAPVHIVIFAKLEREEKFYGVRGTRLYSIQDCAMSAMNIMTAAEAFGLSTCFVSAFDEEVISRIFKLPDEVRPQGVITMGYSDDKPDAPIRYRVESLIGIENYGTAMNEGGGRVADPGAAVSNYRYLERFPRYVKDAANDINRATRKSRSRFFENVMEKVRKMMERKEEKKESQKPLKEDPNSKN